MRLGEPGVEGEGLGAGGQDRVDRDVDVIVEEQEGVAVRDARVGARVHGVEFHGLGEHAPRQLVVRLRVPVKELAAAQVIGVRLDVVGRRLRDRLALLRQQLDLELLDDRVGDLVLDGEDVGQVAVVAVGPDVPAGLAVDELAVDPHLRAGLADAALQHELDVEFLADVLHLDRPCPCR